MKEEKVYRITYSDVCPHCKRLIKGNSPNSCKHNLKMHIWTQHPEIEMDKKELEK